MTQLCDEDSKESDQQLYKRISDIIDTFYYVDDKTCNQLSNNILNLVSQISFEN